MSNIDLVLERGKMFFYNAEAYKEVGEIEGALINYKLAINNFYIFTEIGGDIKKVEDQIKTCIKWIIPFQSELKNIRKMREEMTITKDNDDQNIYNCSEITEGDKKNISFDELIGFSDLANTVQRSIVKPLINPERYPGISTGMLLYGPPGTGKTMFAKAIITELKKSFKKNGKEVEIVFYTPTGADLKGKYVGETEKNITKYYRTMSQCLKDKCSDNSKKIVIGIIFIDECDAIAKSRDGDETGLNALSVNTLLQMMDGINSNPNIITIGATNEPWVLDSAILRRFKTKQLLPVLGWTGSDRGKDVESKIHPNIVELIKKEIGEFYYTSIKNALYMNGNESWQCDLINGAKQDDWVNSDKMKINFYHKLFELVSPRNSEMLNNVLASFENSLKKEQMINLNLCSSSDITTLCQNMIRKATNNIHDNANYESMDTKFNQQFYTDYGISDKNKDQIKKLTYYTQNSVDYSITVGEGKDNDHIFLLDEEYEKMLEYYDMSDVQKDIMQKKTIDMNTEIVSKHGDYTQGHFNEFKNTLESPRLETPNKNHIIKTIINEFDYTGALFPKIEWKEELKEQERFGFSVYIPQTNDLIEGKLGEQINIGDQPSGVWFEKKIVYVSNLANTEAPKKPKLEKGDINTHEKFPNAKKKYNFDLTSFNSLNPYQTAYPYIIEGHHKQLALSKHKISGGTTSFRSPLYGDFCGQTKGLMLGISDYTFNMEYFQIPPFPFFVKTDYGAGFFNNCQNSNDYEFKNDYTLNNQLPNFFNIIKQIYGISDINITEFQGEKYTKEGMIENMNILKQFSIEKSFSGGGNHKRISPKLVKRKNQNKPYKQTSPKLVKRKNQKNVNLQKGGGGIHELLFKYIAEVYVYFAFYSRTDNSIIKEVTEEREYDDLVGTDYIKFEIEMLDVDEELFKYIKYEYTKLDPLNNITDAYRTMINTFKKSDNLIDFRKNAANDLLQLKLANEQTKLKQWEFEVGLEQQNNFEDNVKTFVKTNNEKMEEIKYDDGLFKSNGVTIFSDPLCDALIVNIKKSDLSQENERNLHHYQLAYGNDKFMFYDILSKWFKMGVVTVDNYQDIYHFIVNNPSLSWKNTCFKSRVGLNQQNCPRILSQETKGNIRKAPGKVIESFTSKTPIVNSDLKYPRTELPKRNSIYCTYTQKNPGDKQQTVDDSEKKIKLFVNFLKKDFEYLLNNAKPTIGKETMDEFINYENDPAGFKKK